MYAIPKSNRFEEKMKALVLSDYKHFDYVEATQPVPD
jgi:hypothetical protein